MYFKGPPWYFLKPDSLPFNTGILPSSAGVTLDGQGGVFAIRLFEDARTESPVRRSLVIRDLKNWGRRRTENVEKAIIVLIRKTTTLYSHHSFFAQFFPNTARLRRENS